MPPIHKLIIIAIVFVMAIMVQRASAAEKPKEESFNAKGVKIHYVTQGMGEPVVLIHGLASSAWINWQMPGVFSALAARHQVIALDLPAHGSSDKPEKEEAYGAQMAEDVILLLDHLKIKKAHIVGYSMGGMIALRLISQHPDRVLSGVVGGMGWMAEGGILQNFWEQLPARQKSDALAICIKNMGKLAITQDALKAIRVPMIVLIGDRDPVKKLYVAPLEAVRKDWPVVTIENAGHLDCIIKEKFKTEIVKWVEKNKQTPPTDRAGSAKQPVIK